MVLIRPRITEHHNISLTQSQTDFAIPFLDEDIPLYVDPFLLWKSPSFQDQSLHTSILNCFNHLGYLVKHGRDLEAEKILIIASECNEVGLGTSRNRKGMRIGSRKAQEILSLFKDIPQYRDAGFAHFEEIQLFIEGIGADRISDICCNFMKSFLIDYTMQESEELGIPIVDVAIENLYEYSTNKFVFDKQVSLPVNPQNNAPILFVPKRWMRFSPWIAFEEYFRDYCPRDEIFNPDAPIEKVKILKFNRDNYGVVDNYIKAKIRTQQDCHNDPLFKQIPITSAKRKLQEIRTLDTGNKNAVDKHYEDLIVQLLTSLFYPDLDFAAEQSRTDSGRLIRDLIFYNNRSIDFLEEIYKDYSSNQIVFEIKNVQSIEREHINQLNRYLDSGLGKFGILVTRNELSKAMFSNIIDLWSGQRRCIIALTDQDLDLMVNLFESKQRSPTDVLKKKYLEFRRACPS